MSQPRKTQPGPSQPLPDDQRAYAQRLVGQQLFQVLDDELRVKDDENNVFQYFDSDMDDDDDELDRGTGMMKKPLKKEEGAAKPQEMEFVVPKPVKVANYIPSDQDTVLKTWSMSMDVDRGTGMMEKPPQKEEGAAKPQEMEFVVPKPVKVANYIPSDQDTVLKTWSMSMDVDRGTGMMEKPPQKEEGAAKPQEMEFVVPKPVKVANYIPSDQDAVLETWSRDWDYSSSGISPYQSWSSESEIKRRREIIDSRRNVPTVTQSARQAPKVETVGSVGFMPTPQVTMEDLVRMHPSRATPLDMVMPSSTSKTSTDIPSSSSSFLIKRLPRGPEGRSEVWEATDQVTASSSTSAAEKSAQSTLSRDSLLREKMKDRSSTLRLRHSRSTKEETDELQAGGTGLLERLMGYKQQITDKLKMVGSTAPKRTVIEQHQQKDELLRKMEEAMSSHKTAEQMIRAKRAQMKAKELRLTERQQDKRAAYAKHCVESRLEEWAADAADESNKQYRLPYITRELTWHLVIWLSVVSTIIVVTRSYNYGQAHVGQLLVTVIIALLFNFVVLQPVKAVAIGLYLYFGRMQRVKPMERHKNFKHHVEVDKELHMEDLNKHEEKIVVTARKLPDVRLVNAVGERMMKENYMDTVFKDTFFYLLFVILLFVVIHGHHQGHCHGMYQSLVNHQLEGTLLNTIPFMQVRTYDDIWQYLNTTLLETMLYPSYLTGHLWSYTLDLSNVMVGVIRLRQLRRSRQQPQPGCGDDGYWPTLPCQQAPYSSQDEDQMNYYRGWQSEVIFYIDPISKMMANAWRYETASNLSTPSMYGRHHYYSGGGYVAELTTNYTESLQIVKHLNEHNWLDEHTAALFVEFSLYNPAVKLFQIIPLLLEVTAVGQVEPDVSNIITARLYNPIRDTGEVYLLVIQLLFWVFVFVFAWRLVHILWDETLTYAAKLQSSWPELTIVTLTMVNICLYVAKIVAMEKAMARQYANKWEGFMNWYDIAKLYQAYFYIGSITLTLCIFNFIKVLGLSRHLLVTIQTVSLIFNRLVVVAIIFFVVAFFGIIYIGIHSLGDICEQYSSWAKAATTSIALMSRRLRFWDTEQLMVSPTMAPALFFSTMAMFVFCVLVPCMQIVLIAAMWNSRRIVRQAGPDMHLYEYFLYTMRLYTRPYERIVEREQRDYY